MKKPLFIIFILILSVFIIVNAYYYCLEKKFEENAKKIIITSKRYAEKGDFRRAEEIFETEGKKKVRLKNLNKFYRNYYSKTYHSLCFSSGEYDKVFASVNEGWLYKTSVFGMIFRATGNFTEAKKSLEEDLRIYPEDPEIYLNLGPVYAEIGESEKAVNLLNKMEKLYRNGYFRNSPFPVDQNIIDLAFADVYRAGKDFGKEIEILNKIINNPRSENNKLLIGNAYASISDAYLISGDIEEFGKNAENALRILSENIPEGDLQTSELIKSLKKNLGKYKNLK